MTNRSEYSSYVKKFIDDLCDGIGKLSIDGDKDITKMCNKCKQIKSVNDFYNRTLRSGRITKRGTCKRCEKEQRRRGPKNICADVDVDNLCKGIENILIDNDKVDIKMCNKCKQIKSVNNFYNRTLRSGRSVKRNTCKECECSRVNESRRYGEGFIDNLVNSCRSSAKRRGIKGRKRCEEFDISTEYVKELIVRQNNKCAVSGVNMIWRNNSGWMMGSIDRLDNNRGYTKDNIRLVCWGVNNGLSTFSDDFYDMCSCVKDYRRIYMKNKEIYLKDEKLNQSSFVLLIGEDGEVNIQEVKSIKEEE